MKGAGGRTGALFLKQLLGSGSRLLPCDIRAVVWSVLLDDEVVGEAPEIGGAGDVENFFAVTVNNPVR